MKYTISYEKNGVYQAIGVNAQTAEQAAAYFAQYKPTARYIGIREGMENKPGFPVITVPADFQEAAEEAQQENIFDRIYAELEARKGAAFFVVYGYRIPLDECIRMGV